MKFAAYVAWILLYKCCKFGEKICNNSRDIEFFLEDYFFMARPVCEQIAHSCYVAPVWLGVKPTVMNPARYRQAIQYC